MSSREVASRILEAAGIPLNSSEPWSIQVHNEKMWDRVISQQQLGFAESYMDGWWDCQALDVMITKLLSINVLKLLRPSPALALAFYDNLINTLISAGITPYITLYHWDLPQALEDKGGWRNRDTVAAFGKYAAAVAEHFGDRVKHFAPINEPWCVAWLGHGIGVHAPGISDRPTAFKVAHHTVIAHATAVNAMRAERDLNLNSSFNGSGFGSAGRAITL